MLTPAKIVIALLSLCANAINVIQSNDDGWAEIRLRTFYQSLTNAGFESVISAPAKDQSGTGSHDEEPEDLGKDGCQFHSCPPRSPAIGRNESEPRFNYVNSFPVTSIRYGIEILAPEFFGGPPDIAVTGPNVGSNLGLVTGFSGTVGAAVESVKLGIPAIAFSGRSGHHHSWKSKVKPYMTTYADLATNVTQTLTSSEKPYLPEGIWLNVNFPTHSDKCDRPSKFKFVLSRIYPAVPIIEGDDVETCGKKRLPTERAVINKKGCYASISVANTDKKDAKLEDQAFVLEKLGGILECLPEEDD